MSCDGRLALSALDYGYALDPAAPDNRHRVWQQLRGSSYPVLCADIAVLTPDGRVRRPDAIFWSRGLGAEIDIDEPTASLTLADISEGVAFASRLVN